MLAAREQDLSVKRKVKGESTQVREKVRIESKGGRDLHGSSRMENFLDLFRGKNGSIAVEIGALHSTAELDPKKSCKLATQGVQD